MLSNISAPPLRSPKRIHATWTSCSIVESFHRSDLISWTNKLWNSVRYIWKKLSLPKRYGSYSSYPQTDLACRKAGYVAPSMSVPFKLVKELLFKARLI